MLNRDIAEAVRLMAPGTHAILVYDSQENKRDVLFSHLKYGAGRAGLVYVCTEETPEAIKSEMDGFGVDTKGLEAEGDLSVKKYDEVYVVDGKVDTPKIINSFAFLASEYKERGKEGIRAGAEMNCFFRENKVPELIHYENALHTSLSFPAKGICAYNLVEMGNSGNLELIWPLIRAHGLVIMTGPNGSFALPPPEVEKDVVEATIRAVAR